MVQIKFRKLFTHKIYGTFTVLEFQKIFIKDKVQFMYTGRGDCAYMNRPR
jgi:hypothetical protein